MCGIIGIASKNSIIDYNWVQKGRENLIHRGPDDQGEWVSENKKVIFAHRRLSIIDLSPLGRQPMNYNNQYYVVLNGEIYNYQSLKKILLKDGFTFKTKTDTEVFLLAYVKWGMDWLKRINGMFSFAIYDRKKEKIILGRDRAGEKPLYYHSTNDSIRFASELKGLLVDKKIPRKIDKTALNNYLSIGYVNGERCLLEGFRKLLPGHTLSFCMKSGRLRLDQYWKLPNFGTKSSHHNLESLLIEFQRLFESAVKRQLVSDVPVGVLLSGGLDSSLITAMAARSLNKVNTFTVRFSESKTYDESTHARLISEFYGTSHNEIEADYISENIIKKLANHYDEPIIDSSIIPTFLVTQLVKKHCTVALGGDGGDELFGGYKYYRRMLLINSYISWLSEKFRYPISKIIKLLTPNGFRGENWIKYVGLDLENNFPILLNKFGNAEKLNLLKKQIFEDVNYEYSLNNHNHDIIQRVTRLDFKNYLPNDILAKVDRASMMNSLEMRAPMLDYNIINFAFQKIPSSLKCDKNSNKIFLKKFAQNILPKNFDYNRKQGFEFPLGKLIQTGSIRNLFEDVLYNNDSLFEPKMINQLFNQLDKGYKTEEKLFGLVQLELWKTHNSISY